MKPEQPRDTTRSNPLLPPLGRTGTREVHHRAGAFLPRIVDHAIDVVLDEEVAGGALGVIGGGHLVLADVGRRPEQQIEAARVHLVDERVELLELRLVDDEAVVGRLPRVIDPDRRARDVARAEVVHVVAQLVGIRERVAPLHRGERPARRQCRLRGERDVRTNEIERLRRGVEIELVDAAIGQVERRGDAIGGRLREIDRAGAIVGGEHAHAALRPQHQRHRHVRLVER
ncbi:MAG: hypothetical protein QM765_25765 [Myxococcales bacterium]